ncbi:DUF393 domain-containing protein, partial [bacterium]|nr:DUF393 domain-containing protein [bacterium]
APHGAHPLPGSAGLFFCGKIKPMTSPVLTVYYDGLCVVCSREIEHYQKKDRANAVRWVDITSAEFSASQEGLDEREVHRVMHVRDSSGQLHTEVDAFIAIWRVIPGFRPLARIASWWGARLGLNLGYQIFVRIRPFLPRRKSSVCDDGRCSK